MSPRETGKNLRLYTWSSGHANTSETLFDAWVTRMPGPRIGLKRYGIVLADTAEPVEDGRTASAMGTESFVPRGEKIDLLGGTKHNASGDGCVMTLRNHASLWLIPAILWIVHCSLRS